MRKTILALVTTTALGLAASGPALADLTAQSYISIQDLQFLDASGAILDADTDFDSLTFTSSADQDGALTGTAGFNDDEPNGGDIDFTAKCLSTTGDCNVLNENQQPPTLITGPQGTDYVTADQFQGGAPIANLQNLIDDPSGGTGFTTGADILQIAQASLSTTTAEGTANVNNGLEANWEFSLTGGAAGEITVSAANLSYYLEAFAEAGEIFPGKAAAGNFFTITITDVATGQIVWDEDIIDETTAANANGFAFDIKTCGNVAGIVGGCGLAPVSIDNFAINTPALAAETLYQLSIRSNANVDIARVNVAVPEPSILALMGLGFLGMALGRRRRG